MTDQRDPLRRRPGDYIRRDDGRWAMLPLLAAIAIVVLLGYLLFRDNVNAPNATAKRSEAPTSTSPRNTPTPPATSPSQK